jgi:uncharacterized Tic20 family protein
MTKNYDDLEKLNDLYTRGVLTETEFNKEKEKILNSAGSLANNKLFGLKENTYCLIIHLSLFLGCIHFIIGLLAPFLLWIINKDNYKSVNNHGRIVFNWICSIAIYSVVLMAIILPFNMFNNFAFNYSTPFSSSFTPTFSSPFPSPSPLAMLASFLHIVFIIVGAIKANAGIYWNYPLSIRFFKLKE